jgi:hypothetical protein
MGGPYAEVPYPALSPADFGPGSQYQVALQNGGRTVVIGDVSDIALQNTHVLIQPNPDETDVVIHGLPGRFVEALGGHHEIPVPVVVNLLDNAGITRGTPLRLLTCHAAEVPHNGGTIAQMLATEWRGPVSGPNGLLRIFGRGRIRIDLVDWILGPGGVEIDPTTIQMGRGRFIPHTP